MGGTFYRDETSPVGGRDFLSRLGLVCLVGGTCSRDWDQSGCWEGLPVETVASTLNSRDILWQLDTLLWWQWRKWPSISSSVSSRVEVAASLSLLRACGSDGIVGGAWRPYASLPCFHTGGGGAMSCALSLSLSLSLKTCNQGSRLHPSPRPLALSSSFFLSFFLCF